MRSLTTLRSKENLPTVMRHLFAENKTATQPGQLSALFFKNIKWNAFGNFIYQSALSVHYGILFWQADRFFFGSVSLISSIVFLGATALNSGLDNMIATFFSRCCSSKDNFRTTVMRHLGGTLVVLGTASLVLLFLFRYTWLGLPSYLSIRLTFVLWGIVICECARKSLRMILQLALLVPTVALTEALTGCCYLFLVWTPYICGAPLSMMGLFLPLLICWLATAVIFSFFVYRWYKQLPSFSLLQNKPKHFVIFKNRLLNIINQGAHQAFSSNGLVPILALKSGLILAGQIKIACYLAYSFTTIFQKTVSFSATILFAQAEKNNVMRRSLVLANSVVIKTIGLSLFFVFALFFGARLLFAEYFSSATYLNLFAIVFLMHMSEIFFTAYERALIAQGKIFFLVIINSATALSLISLVRFSSLSFFSTLACMLIVRVTTYVCLRVYTVSTINHTYEKYQPASTFKPTLKKIALLPGQTENSQCQMPTKPALGRHFEKRQQG